MGQENGETEISNGADEPKPEPVENTLDPLEEYGSRSGYEQLREQRIKENLERMRQMGILQLSQRLKYSSSPCVIKRPFQRKTYFQRSRQSSRLENEKLGVKLENVVCLSYNPKVRKPRLRLPKVSLPKESLPEVNIPKVKKKVKKEKLARKEGEKLKVGRLVVRGKSVKKKAEKYTEEDEKLLGSTELSWTLCVDGYGADGRRIYDQINGKSCHQCRQKTLGLRTSCSQCQKVRGQYCGDCLYMRYGEHILEANKNPDWICPICRGICNCSLCRNAKGWPPTGLMYRKIVNSGYKSVAHYLIQTKRASPESSDTESEDIDHKTPHSAKRSLTFKDMEVPTDGQEPQKKAITGQKLDYRDNETGEFEISPNLVKEEAVSSSEPDAVFLDSGAINSCKKANQVASEERLKTSEKAVENEVVSSDKKLMQETVSSTSELSAAVFGEKGATNLCMILVASQDACEERLNTTDKAGEKEVVLSDKNVAQEKSQSTDKAVSYSEHSAVSGTTNLCMIANQDVSEERLNTTDKAGEKEVVSSEKKPVQETVSQSTDSVVSYSEHSAVSGAINLCMITNQDACEERLKTADQAGANEVISSDKKLAQETVSQATDIVVSSGEPAASFVGSRTRSSCKGAKPDASEGRLETPEKGCATKSCRKAKRSYSPSAIQDSIARRLRPRTTNKT